MVPSIITHIFEKDENAYVLLMSAVSSEKIHEKLRKVFNEKQLEKIIINYGHRTSKDFYKDYNILQIQGNKNKENLKIFQLREIFKEYNSMFLEIFNSYNSSQKKCQNYIILLKNLELFEESILEEVIHTISLSIADNMIFPSPLKII